MKIRAKIYVFFSLSSSTLINWSTLGSLGLHSVNGIDGEKNEDVCRIGQNWVIKFTTFLDCSLLQLEVLNIFQFFLCGERICDFLRVEWGKGDFNSSEILITVSLFV